MLQRTTEPDEEALEVRVRDLREQLARAERQLRAARGGPAQEPAHADGALLAWHESVERALEQALGRLRSHVESSPLAVIEWSADHRVVGWSRAAERLFGWTADEVRGRRIEDLGLGGAEDGSGPEQLLGLMEAISRPGDVRASRTVRKDGVAVWCEWYNSVLRDRAGRVASVLSLVLDVTQRRRAEDALHASQAAAARRAAEQETVFETLEFPVLVFDAEARPVQGNSAARTMLGVDPAGLSADAYVAQVIGSLRMRYRGGRPLEPEELPVRRAVLGEEVRGQLVEITDREGRPRALTVTGLPLRMDGRVSGAVVVWYDVTERLGAEERFRTLADNAPEVIVRFDRDLRHLYVNAAMEAATGLAPHRLEGRRLEESPLPPEMIALWSGVVRRVFATGVPERFEFRFDPPPGPAHYEALVVPERDAGGEIDSVLALTRNVTDRKRLEAARQEETARETALRRAAESAVRAKDEFLALLGHELRNPLAPILTAVQLLDAQAGSAFARERAIIERHAHHMVRLVDDLLDVSRITRGTVKLERRPVDLRAVIGRAVEMVGPLLEERGHELEVAVPPGLVVDGDEDRLAQVFTNLLTNAARFTSRPGRILVQGAAQAERVRVAVRDDGVGIAPELLPRIFDLFVQGDRRLDRAQGGLGLGLTLVRMLTEAHGGRVEARSDGAGRGSEFIVELPLRALEPRGRACPGGVIPARNGRHREGRRVLVVDDNQDAAEMLAEGLRLHGHQVRVAYDGPEALLAAAELDPEVALVDIGLPVMNGYELARRLRGREGTRCHLVAVTGYGQESDRARSREHGFDAHVVKPVDLEGIRELVHCAPRGAR